MAKVYYPLDKHDWSPSLIPGPIMLVTTINEQGEPNAAPKSWVQMVSFTPPLVMYSGSRGNTTEINIEQTACFALNIVSETMVTSVLNCLQWYGQERIDQSGWHLTPARKIPAPLIEESPAHLECTLEKTVDAGSGYIIIGRIIAASIDEKLIDLPLEERYEQLAQTCILEENVYSRIRACKV